jgi:hypothetical protein
MMRALVLVLLASLSISAVASDAVREEPRPPVRPAPFEETVAEIRKLTEAELKRFYLKCSRASVRGRISGGEIQLCSVGYEQLLQRVFGGNFQEFLEWRRNAVRRDETS